MSALRGLFARPSDLEPDKRKLLLLLGAAFFIGQYDMALLTLALPDVQASFAIAEEDLGQLMALMRLGALPAIALALLADSIGRRRLLVVTLFGLSLFAIATGFARTEAQFITFQCAARLFITLEEILAVIYALEMLPARHRGWGVGFLAAMGGLGSGLASVLYGGVEYFPGQWRSLYVFGGLSILYVAWLRRSLPESALFEVQVGTRLRPAFLDPMRLLLANHRRALVALTIIAAAFAFPVIASLNFMSKFLQSIHGYTPQQVSILFVVAGAFAIFGNVLAGRAADAFGRRPILGIALALNCAAFLAFYNSSGWLLPLAWIAALFSFFAADVIINAISGELFPTACRSTAATLRMLTGVVAGAAGLLVEGSLYSLLGSHAEALSWMVLTTLVALPVVVWWLPETARIQLD